MKTTLVSIDDVIYNLHDCFKYIWECGKIDISEDEFLFLRSIIFNNIRELSEENGLDIDINDMINQLKKVGGYKCSEM